jgi:hypothetical protein
MSQDIICDKNEVFTPSETFDIIEHFRENRLLWDIKDKNYKNNQARLQSMMNLVELLSQKRGSQSEIKGFLKN